MSFKRNRMSLLAVYIFCFAIGCDTADSRREISNRTKNLAATVKSRPDSEEAKKALDDLIEILNSRWTFARCQACYSLDELGPLAAPAVPHLIKAIETGEMFVSQDAVRGLRNIGPAAAPATSLLTSIVDEAISNNTPSLRAMYAMEALGNIGKPALTAIPSLKRASHSSDRLFAKTAKQALAKLQKLKLETEGINGARNSFLRSKWPNLVYVQAYIDRLNSFGLHITIRIVDSDIRHGLRYRCAHC